MDLFGQLEVDVVVEGQGYLLAFSVDVVVDILAAFDHEYLLAVANFWFDHYIGVRVDGAVLDCYSG